METITLTTSSQDRKLLTFLKSKLGEQWTTREIRWLIEHNRCQVNGFVERFCSTSLRKGDQISIRLEKRVAAQKEPERILFENESLLIYNKPAAISAEELGTMLNLLLVHRLDRDTTGAILLAKTVEAQAELEQLFRQHKVNKSYVAWVSPPPKQKKGSINYPLAQVRKREGAVKWGVVANGKEAQTDWLCVKRREGAALLRLFPKTGRTHQIRVHLSAFGSPIIGDVEYGNRIQKGVRPLLHAEKISFPFAGKEIQVLAPLPDDFA